MSVTPKFTFTTAPGELAGVSAFGAGGPPPADYYATDILRLEPTDKPNSGKMILTVPSVPEYQQAAHMSEIWTWWNLTIPNPHNDPEIAYSNNLALKGQRSTLESIGYSSEIIDRGGVSHLWLVPDEPSAPRLRCYVAYVPPEQGAPKGSKAANAQVDFITKEAFVTMKATGTPPTRRADRNAAPSAPVPPAPGGWAPPAAPPPPPAAAARPGGPPAPPPAPAAPPPPAAAAPPMAPPPPPAAAPVRPPLPPAPPPPR